MKELTTKELKNINGGGLTLAGGLLIVAGIIFLAGVIDGFVRPLPCKK